MRRLLLGVAVVLILVGTAQAQDAVPRYLEFRDGSVIRLPVVDEEWKITLLKTDGKIESTSLRLSSLERLILMPEPVLEKKRALLDVIKQLGADKYQEREQAQEKLFKMGVLIRPDLEGAREAFTDLEVLSRIEQILAKLPPSPAGQAIKMADTFDSFVGKETLRGDAGEGNVGVQIDGQTRRLSRKEVRSVSVKPPELNDLMLSRRLTAGFRRIDAGDFPPGCTEESFDVAPGGRKLTIGENIEKLFISKGFTLATSVPTSFVSVNDFVVQGKSRGMSAATHQPLFQGELTIRFCRPGQENQPAGVTHFGLWIAHVMPRGTMMIAFDLQGRELGNIQTTRDGHEFLGVQSSVPMHRIKLTPNLQVDPDFTLDDFIFALARTSEAAHAEKFLVQFEDGERVFCTDVSFAQQTVRMHGLPAGLPDRSRPIKELVRIAAPERDRPERPTPVSGAFVELRDGSVIFGAQPAKPGGPTFARRPDVLKEKDQIIGLWSAESPRTTWPAKTDPPVAWDAEKKIWRGISNVTFAEEAIVWTVEGKRRARSYFESSPILVGPLPGEPQVGSWRVRTIHGEEIVLGNAAAPPVSGTLSKQLEAKWGGIDLKIPAAEIVSVFRVVKE